MTLEKKSHVLLLQDASLAILSFDSYPGPNSEMGNPSLGIGLGIGNDSSQTPFCWHSVTSRRSQRLSARNGNDVSNPPCLSDCCGPPPSHLVSHPRTQLCDSVGVAAPCMRSTRCILREYRQGTQLPPGITTAHRALCACCAA